VKTPYFHIDAFTDQQFHGNPAGVCPLDHWLPDEVMQQIAAENKHAETAFFVPEGDAFRLRWFTPKSEVDLCGHATLATAFVLSNFLNYKRDLIVFETRSGRLTVEVQGRLLLMDFPARPAEKYPEPAELVQALGRSPLKVLRARDALVVFAAEKDILAIEPDFDRLAKLPVLGVIVTAPGDKVDFVSRFFAPGVGVPEDPVTGSSHCTLVPYWAAKLGKTRLHARQLSERGGELFCELAGERVKIGGHAVAYLRGEIEI